MGNFTDFLMRYGLDKSSDEKKTDGSDAEKESGGAFTQFLDQYGLNGKMTFSHVKADTSQVAAGQLMGSGRYSTNDAPKIKTPSVLPAQFTAPATGVAQRVDSTVMARQSSLKPILDNNAPAFSQIAVPEMNDATRAYIDSAILQPVQQMSKQLNMGGFGTNEELEHFLSRTSELRNTLTGLRTQHMGDQQMQDYINRLSAGLTDLEKTAQGRRASTHAGQMVSEGAAAYIQAQEAAARGEDSADLMGKYYSSLFYRNNFGKESNYVRKDSIPIYAASQNDVENWDRSDRSAFQDMENLPSEELLYEAINGNWAAILTLAKSKFNYDAIWDGLNLSYRNSNGVNFTFMSESDVALFNYLFNTQGLDSAKQYLNLIAEDVSQKQRIAYTKARAEEARQAPVLSSIESVIETPFKSLINIVPAAIDSVDGKITENAPYMYDTFKKNAVRGAVTDSIGSDFGKMAYQVGMSIADSATRAALSLGNPALSSAMMAGDVYAGGLVSGKDRGLEDWKSIALAGISTVAEIGAEHIKFDKLFSNPSLTKSTIRKYLIENMATEGLEEMTTEGINILADTLISQDKSQWTQAVNAYKAQGKSESQAWWLALRDQGASILGAGLAGAISGGVMSGGTAAIDYLSGTMPDAPSIVPKLEEAVNAEYHKRLELAREDGSPVDAAGVYQSVITDLASGKLEGYEVSAEKMAQVYNGYRMYLAQFGAATNAKGSDSGSVRNYGSSAINSERNVTNAPQNDAISRALELVRQSGTITNSMAEAILADGEAMATLTERTGLVLPDNASGKRNAVKQSVAKLAERLTKGLHPGVDTAPQNGYDNQNTTGGNLYDAGQVGPEAHIYRTAETGYRGIQGEASAETGKRPGIQSEMGENRGTLPENSTDWGQRDRLTDAEEPYAPENYIQPEEGSPLQQTQRGFSDRRINCRVVRADKWGRENPAFTRAGKVYISDGIDPDTLRTAIPHEESHVMQQSGFAPYLDFISRTPDMLNMKSDGIGQLMGLVEAHRGVEAGEMDDWDYVRFYDELNAIVYGMEKSGILADSDYAYGDFIPDAFNDFEGYIRELDAIHEQFAQAQSSKTESGFVSEGNEQASQPVPDFGEEVRRQFYASHGVDNQSEPVSAADTSISLAEQIRQEENQGGNSYGQSGNEVGGRLLSGGPGWESGTGSGRPTGRMVQGTGSTTQGTDQRAAASSRQGSVNALGQPTVSASSLGIKNGSKANTLRVMPQELWDDELNDVANRIYEKTGKRVTYVIGGLMINGPDGARLANGAWTDMGIIIKVDHQRFTATQIADHEIFHDMTYRTPGLVKRIEDSVREKFTNGELDQVIADYSSRLSLLPEDATAKDIEEAAKRVLDEVLADAYAGVNRFGSNAAQFHEEARYWGDESLQLMNQSQENGVRETAGPPVEQYLIDDIVGENGEYGIGVHLDTDIFDGVRPSAWGRVLGDFVYRHLAGTSVTVFDENGNPEDIYFANINDRVRKDGAKNSHKVIDKLARYRGDNVRALSTVHLSELLEASKYEASTSEHSHQWMDENGWEIRKVYIQDNSDRIYEATLNIAKGRDRRILYDVNNIRLVDKKRATRGDVPSTETGRGSHTKGNSSRAMLADDFDSVKGVAADAQASDAQIDGEYGPSANSQQDRFMEDDTVIDGKRTYTPEDLKDVPEYRPGMQYESDRQGVTPDAEFIADVEGRALKAKADLMRNIPKADFKGTGALGKLGIQVDNSVGDYSMVKSMIANDRAAKDIIREMRSAEKRLNATAGEKNYAAGIAGGYFHAANIPSDMDSEKVLELADYLWATKAITSDLIEKRRDDIRKTLLHKMDRIMRKVDTSKIRLPKAFTLHHRSAVRNMTTIFGTEIGGELNAFLFEPVATNEAERYRFINRMHDEVRQFEGEDGKKKKLNKAERALVQMVIEGTAVEETVAGMEMRHAIKNAAHNINNGSDPSDAAREFSLNTEERKLAVQYSRWMQTQEALTKDNVDAVRIDNAVQKYRELFDLFHEAINDFLVAHGYEPIGYIRGYAPHMQPEETQTALRWALEKLGIPQDVSTLPTSIAGLTKDYKPNKRWNPFFLSRRGDVTKYDIVTAFESYVDYMSDVIYHTDDIMRVRQATQYLRKLYAPERNHDLIDQALELRYSSVEEKLAFLRENDQIGLISFPSEAEINKALDEYIDTLFGNLGDKTLYSDFVMWLDDYANKLAGKQLSADRNQERTLGRTSLNFIGKLRRAFARAQVAGNISSALNQLAQLPQVIGENGVWNTVLALEDMATFRLRRTGWYQDSDFLTEKKGVRYIVNSVGDMIVGGMFKPAEFMDSALSTLAVRGRYLKEIEAGKSHVEAMKAADRFGRNVMGSRAKGSIPLAFQQKGIFAQFFHTFQVEAANSWEHIVVDLPQDFRQIQQEKGVGAAAGALAGVILKTLISAFFLNRFSEELYGGTPAPYDLLGLTANFIASGQELSTNEYLLTVMDDCMEQIIGKRVFKTDNEETLSDGEFDWTSALKDGWYNVSNDIPYLRNAFALLGWGDDTLPIPDLLGTGTDIVNALADEDAGLFSYEMGQALLGLAGDILPGGRQLEKTVAGIETAVRGGKYKGHGDNAKLQYPVDVDWKTAIRLALFGDAAASERNAFYASGDSPLTANQTDTYESLVSEGVDPKEAYRAIQDYRKADNDDALSSVERGKNCRDIIRNMGMSDELKLQMYRDMTGADSTAEKLQVLMDTGLSWNIVMDIYDEYARLRADDEMYATEQVTEFSKWLDGQNYSSEQKTAAKEQLLFWNMFPAQATEYDSFVESGLNPDDAYELVAEIDNLEPVGDADDVSDLQEWRVCVDFSSNEDVQLAALASRMTDNQFAKVQIAHEMDVSPDIYISFKEKVAEIADGNPTNKEVEKAIDSMRGLSTKEKAILWQLGTGSSSAKNNPYSTRQGQKVLNALEERED